MATLGTEVLLGREFTDADNQDATLDRVEANTPRTKPRRHPHLR